MALYRTDADKNLIKIAGKATRQLPLGAIFCSAIVLTDPAYKRLDGQCIAIDGVYSQFCEWLISQSSLGNVPTCTIGEYGTELSTYGQCGKFVINTTNEILTENGATVEANSIKLPTVTAFIESSNNTYPIGTTKEAGLPDITGSVGSVTFRTASASGAFSLSGSGSYGQADSSTNTRRTIYFNASDSNDIYGKSDTVQPKSVSYPYYIVVATVTKTKVEVDINNVLTEVGNVSKRYLTETWSLEDGTLWYNIYNDDWKECGGTFAEATTSYQNQQIAFPISFTKTPTVTGCKYNTTAYTSSSSNATNDSVANRAFQINRISTTGFYLNYVSVNFHTQWRAEGY